MAATLTDGDRKIMLLAWQCLKNTPQVTFDCLRADMAQLTFARQVDYKKLHEMGGYKNAASATAVYLAARKKLLNGNGDKLTEGARKIIGLAWQCFKTAPEIHTED